MTNYDLIIREGLVVQKNGQTSQQDIACCAGRIEKISASIDATAQRELNVNGQLVIPGVIDAQVHFRDPGNTHKEDLASGSRAAVGGGVTSFLEMPNTNPPTINQQALDAKLAHAAKVSCANYGFFIGATSNNLHSINTAKPACGIKIFMGSSTGNLLVHKEEDLRNIFANGDRLIAVHAEDENRLRQRIKSIVENRNSPISVRKHTEVRDVECALLATRRAAELAIEFNRRLHVLHLTSAAEVKYLRDHKSNLITVECTPNHLFLTEDDYDRLGTLMQMNPPIRAHSDQSALWNGLQDGTIDFIATDHAPHTLAEKAKPYPESPSGMPGVQTSLPLMLTAFKAERCSLKQIMKWMCWRPAEVYGIISKGELDEGYDADITVCNMDKYRPVKNEEMFTKVGWSPFAGQELVGWPTFTIVGGQVAYAEGQIDDSVRGQPIQFLS